MAVVEETYRTVIAVPINENVRYFDLDLCTSKQITSSASITQYPVQSGVTASDHMYRNPRTLTLSGKFGLNGRRSQESENTYKKENILPFGEEGNQTWEDFLQGDGSGLKAISDDNRLETIQTLFEWIQANGILCQIMMANTTARQPGNTSYTRFKVRDNMALQNISWTEYYNTMEYTLTFQEVIQVSTFSSFEWFEYNELFPSSVMPGTKSVGEIIQESGSLVDEIIKALINEGYIAKADAAAWTFSPVKSNRDDSWDNWKASVSGVIAGTLAAAIGAAYLSVAVEIGAAVVSSLAATGVGLIVVGAVAIAAGIGISIWKTIQNQKKKKRLAEGFNLIKNYKSKINEKTYALKSEITAEDENYSDIQRLRQLMNFTQNNVTQVLSGITVYQMPTDEESQKNGCTFALPVGNEIFYVTIAPNGDGFTYTFMDGPDATSAKVVPYYFGPWTYCTSIDEMSRNTNVVYVSPDLNYELYLYNPSLNDYVLQNSSDPAAAERSGKSTLACYYFIVSQGRIQDQYSKLSKTIIDSLNQFGLEVNEPKTAKKKEKK